MTYVSTACCRICQSDLSVKICALEKVRKIKTVNKWRRTVKIDLTTVIVNDFTGLEKDNEY